MPARAKTLPLLPEKVAEIRAPPTAPEKMLAAAAAIVRELEPFTTDSTKMRILAIASAAYGREADARWFLESASEPSLRSPRCSRCGHVHGKTRAHG